MSDINQLKLLLKPRNFIGISINAASRRIEAYHALQMCFRMYVCMYKDNYKFL